MPAFKSKRQARFMFAKMPSVAKKMAAKTPSIKRLPERASKGKGKGRKK